MKSNKEILVIEDHESIRMLLAKFLSKDYSVTTKKDGLEGLAHLSQGNIPDLIMLDMSLPNINGLDFLSNIRSSGFFSHLPILVVSGEESNRVIKKCHSLGVSGYITKPFNPIDLKTKIKAILSDEGQKRVQFAK